MTRTTGSAPSASTPCITSVTGSERNRASRRSTTPSTSLTSRSPGPVLRTTARTRTTATSNADARVRHSMRLGRGGGSPDGLRRRPVPAEETTGVIPPGRSSPAGTVATSGHRHVEVGTVRQTPGRRSRWRRARSVAVVGALLLTGAGCQADQPQPAPGPQRGSQVVVASFSFPESDLLAEIYAQALEGVGVPVRREVDVGPRELVQPALRQGLVDLVPEYLGTALSSVSPDSTVDVGDPVAVRAALNDAL